MIKTWAICSLLAFATLSTARADCDDLDNFLSVPSPLTEDTTIYLDVETIDCEALLTDMEVEEIVVEGGTLTITSENTVQFINVAFTVMSGAALVFDMPETKFGPNDSANQDFPSGQLIDISEDASVKFNGDVVAQEVTNVDIFIRNAGTLEFKKTAYFENNINGIPVNTGTIKFRGDTTFKGQDGLALDNEAGGFVRFSETATFDDNGSDLDGFSGCDVMNTDLTSKIVFRGDATFSNTRCRSAEGASVYNNGIMNFYGKAYFNDNTSGSNGGAVRNDVGSMTFRRAVQFNNNDAGYNGGGIAVEGGDVTFKKAVKFVGNNADSGGAFAVLFGEKFDNGQVISSGFGTLTFEKPSVVKFVDNTVNTDSGDNDNNCTVGDVEDGSTVIGFPDDDVCVAASA